MAIINNNIFTLKNGKSFLRKNIYNKFHSSILLDKQLEYIKNYLKEKYDIDSMSINWIDKTNTYLFSNVHYDVWHEYAWMDDINIMSKGLNNLTLLPTGGSGVNFLPEFRDNKNIDIRAAVIGEFKQGLEIIFTNEATGNKIQFSIGFPNNKSIISVSAKNYFSILQTLKKIEDFLDPFMECFQKEGNIQDTLELEKILKLRPLKLIF
jgi:hypothetical protein